MTFAKVLRGIAVKDPSRRACSSKAATHSWYLVEDPRAPHILVARRKRQKTGLNTRGPSRERVTLPLVTACGGGSDFVPRLVVERASMPRRVSRPLSIALEGAA